MNAQEIIDKLKMLNPEYADRFRLGSSGASVLYDLDSKRSAIIYGGTLTSKTFPVINRH